MSDINQGILIEHLIHLTRLSEIQWKEVQFAGSTNCYEADYKGFHFFMEWLRDEKPVLCIEKPDGNRETVSGYQVKSLIRTAQDQCETPEKIAKREADKKRTEEFQAQNADKKNNFVVEVLNALKE